MKKILTILAAGSAMAATLTCCTDEIKFGSAFIEKAPGGTVTLDTVFNSATYTEQYLTALYSRQYYGLPYKSDVGQNSASPYVGKFDALTDCYHLHWGSTTVYNSYYSNTLNSNNTPLMGFTSELVWEVVRQAQILIENLPNVPDLTDDQRNSWAAQAKCLMAARYFDLFCHYGGLPIVDQVYTGSESSFEMPRRSVEATVEYMVGLLDEAIPYLRWAWDGNTSETNSTNQGRWTKAGAMALKAKILWFAAAPIFNSDKPYYDGSTQAEMDSLVWYGNYDASRWTRAYQACKDFFDANDANGGTYGLYKATGTTCDAYRQAYRMGYILDDSPEQIHYTRVTSTYGSQGTYCWWNWGYYSYGINRNNYTPTVEYMEMFPKSDGTPFSWDSVGVEDTETMTTPVESESLFYKWTISSRGSSKTASRDPRLYENIWVNAQNEALSWTTGQSDGNILELWVGGYHQGFTVVNEAGEIAETLASISPTGFGNIKYLLGEEYHRNYNLHWNYLTYPEMLLMYAECMIQNGGDITTALGYVDQLRTRVGMKTILSKNTTLAKNLTKEGALEEVLRERACELGLTNARFLDMIRYKRTDWMVKELHGLATYRLKQSSTGAWVRTMTPYLGDDKDAGVQEPYKFDYEMFTLRNRRREMWNHDADELEVKKWLMSPFPSTEINKGYGLVQNPGW